MTSSSVVASASEAPGPLARVGIIGAGFLGRPLAGMLAAERSVIATTRSGEPWAATDGVEVRALDVVADEASRVEAALSGVDALVICMAAGRQQDRRKVYVEGTARILEAFAPASKDLSQGAGRVVYVSSTSALADAEGWVDEEALAWPSSERGRVQREAEERVIALCEARGWSWFVLRLGGLYGPGRGLGRIYRGDPERILSGDGMQATNLIHRDDAIHAVVAALRAPAGVSARVHVCDDDHRPRREMYALLAESQGGAAPRWELEPRSAEVRGKRVANGRLKELLGVSLRYPAHALEA